MKNKVKCSLFHKTWVLIKDMATQIHIFYKELGERIRATRKAIKMSQTELGQALGIGDTAVGNYEKGMRKLTPMELRRVAEALKVSVSWLVYLENPKDITPAEESFVVRLRALTPTQHAHVSDALEFCETANREMPQTAKRAQFERGPELQNLRVATRRIQGALRTDDGKTYDALEEIARKIGQLIEPQNGEGPQKGKRTAGSSKSSGNSAESPVSSGNRIRRKS